MTCLPGIAVRGELHSTDASAGVAIKMYEDGSLTERTLAADEILLIDSTFVMPSTTGAGDTHFFIGADATPGAGETIIRGTIANAAQSPWMSLCPGGKSIGKGLTPWLDTAGAGVIDIQFSGRILKA